MKASVLNRYLIKEVGLVWVAVTVVLLAVLLTNYLARIMSDAAGGELPASAILHLVGLTVLGYFAPLLPAAFFLATVLAFGRLYRDNEMPVLAAVGVGPYRLYRALFLIALPVALVVGGLSLWAAPWAKRATEEVRAQAQQNLELENLRAGRFLTSKRADGMFYLEDVGPDGKMRDVFLQTRSEDRLVLVTARTASMTLDPQTGERFVVLEDGHRFEGVPGTRSWRIVSFAEHGIRIGELPVSPARVRRQGLPLEVLLALPTRENLVELQWRLSMPLMVLTLAWIAVPLSKTEPRQGRYAKMVSAVLVFAVYLNLLKAAQDWVADGRIPLWLGLWWVHGVVVVLGAILLAHRFGLVRRPRRRRRS
jgi:lipopolysaccharide export system permease protein